MFSLKQKNIRIRFFRLAVFLLAAATGISISKLVKPHPVQKITVGPRIFVIEVESRLRITSFPKIDFPDSIRQLDRSNFYIELTAVLDDEGRLTNVASNPGLAITFIERSYVETTVPRIGTERALALRKELVTLLTKQIESIKFYRNAYNGPSGSLPVLITVHFESVTSPSRSGFRCAEMKANVDLNGHQLWSGITSTDRYKACSDK